jgi:hypothetical protein
MLINYIDTFPQTVSLAQGKDIHFVSLEKLPEPYKRADGKRVSYLLHYRELSVTANADNDEAWACVNCSGYTYWSAKELKELGVSIGRNGNIHIPDGYDIFEHIHIFN